MRKTNLTVMSPSKHSKRFSPARQRLLFALLTFSSLTSGSAAWAGGSVLPQGGHFVGGTGAIAPKGNNGLSISQTTQTGVIDWNSFSIGQHNSVTIANGNGVTLNRVTGGTLSTIAGSLKATGSVYVVNTAGLVVSGSGKVVAGGSVVLSSRDVSDSAFMAGGAVEATGNSTGTVDNRGSITSTNGDVVLVGKSVSNSGSVDASKGTATLAAGDDVLLQADGDDTVLVKSGSGDVSNSGTVEAAQVALNAAGGNVYALAVNNGGVIRATGTATKDGHVYLTAGDDLTVNSSVSATNADGSGGAIVATATTVSVGSKARISATGTTKGGTVLIGGDRHGGTDRSVALSSQAIADAATTTVAKGARISADGGAKGDGGGVVIWSNQSTSFAGSISAQGGKSGGNGGFVEVSSEQVLSLTGAVSTRAAHGATGTLLLDPNDVTIYSSTDPGPNTTANTTYILNTDLDSQLNSNNVTITTSGAIHFGTNNAPAGGGSGAFIHSAPIFWSKDFSLTLNAGTFIDTPGGNPNGTTGGFNPNASSTLIDSEAGGAITFNASGTGLTAAATVISLTGDITGSGGTISLLAQGATYRVEIGNNVRVINTSAVGAGKIILQGDQVRLGTGSGPTALVETPGEVDVVPYSSGAVVVGDIDANGQYGNDDNTTLIRSEDIINVHANLLVVGSTSTTTMSLTTVDRAGESAQGGFPTIDAAYVNDLELLTGTNGSVTQDANTAIVVHDVNFQTGNGAQLAVGDGGLAVVTGGAITLNSPYNSVGTIAFNQTGAGGNISFTRQGDQDPSSVGLIVGDIAGVRGITTAGAGRTVTISVNETTANPAASDPGSSISPVALGGIAVTQLGGTDAITTPNLDLEGVASSFALDNISNAFGKVAATVASLSLHDNVALTTGTVGSSTGVNATGNVTIVDSGLLTIGSGAGITTTGGNIETEDQTFTNSDGANAFTAGAGKTWRVYSQDPRNDSDNINALSYSFVQYNAANSYASPFGATLNASASGNGFIYAVAPVLKEAISGTFNKVYDGTNAFTGTLTSSNYTPTTGFTGINGDQITFSAPPTGMGVATYAQSNVANNIVITLTTAPTASAVDPKGVQIFGYTFTPTITLKGNITPLGLTVSGTRAYDGMTDAAGSILTTITGEIAGDGTLTVTGTGVLASKDASTTATNISNLTGLSLSGTNAGNYKISSGTVTVTPLDVTLTGTRAYDGMTDASSTLLTITGKITGDTVSVSGTGVLASKNASTTATNISDLSGLSLTGADAGDYHIASGTVLVTPLGLTVSGTRVYNGSTTASGSILTTITGEIAGDGTLTVGGSGTLASKNASTTATNISSLTGLTLSGTNAGNYKIASGTVLVTPLGLTVSGTRVYDGSTTAAGSILTTVTGEVSGDGTLTVGGSGTLASKDANTTATNISTLTGLTLSGTNAGNYKITSGTVLVTPLGLTVSGTRVYDGTTTASSTILTTITGEISGDGTLTVGGSGTLASKNASTTATNISSLSGLTLSGTNAGDYKIASGTVLVTPLGLTVSGTRTYDGTTTAAGSILTTITGEISGDGTLTVGGSGTLASKNANTTATNISSLSGLTLSGTNAGNYKIASGTVLVTPLGITLTGTRTYDGMTDASGTILTINGKIGGDTVSVSGSGTLASKNASTTPTNISSLSGLSLTGADAGNYKINSGKVTVTPLGLTVSGTRTYDGTTTAAGSILTTITGEVSGDGTLTVGGSGTLASKNANTTATNISTLSGLTLSGTNAGNYKIASGTVLVTPLGLTVSGTRTYDGTTTAAGSILTTITGEVSGDGTLTVGGSGTLASKNANTTATNISTLSGLTLSGTNAGNYKIASGTVLVTPLGLTVSGTRTYDGSTTAAGSILTTITGEVSGDGTLTVGGSGTLASKNASTTATNISSLSGLTLSGTNAGNYKIASGTVLVTPLGLTVSGTRTYDGTTTAAGSILTTVTGEISGDGTLTVGGSGTLASKNASTTPTNISSLTGLTLSGTNAGNYKITSGTVKVTPLGITLTGTRTYDGDVDASGSILTINGKITGDTVSVSGSGSLASKNANTTPTNISTLTGLSLTGGDAGNYKIISGTVLVTPLTVTVTGTRGYDGGTDASGTILSVNGEISGDGTLTVTGSGTLGGKNASTTPTDITGLGTLGLTGTNSGNYKIGGGAVTVTPINLTITPDAFTRAFDGSTTDKTAYSDVAGNYMASGLVGGDTLGNSGSALFLTGSMLFDGSSATVLRNAGTYSQAKGTLALSGSGAGNYNLVFTNPHPNNYVITPEAVTIVGLNGTRVYDGMTDANSSILNITNVASGDQVTVTGTGVLASKNVGKETITGIGTLALGGANAGNYEIEVGRPNATYVIVTPATLTISAVTQTKTYDGTVTSTGTPTVVGLQTGDSTVGTLMQAYGSKNVLGTNKSSLSAAHDIGVNDGDGGKNYVIVYKTAQGTILPEAITISATTQTKVYDGTTASTDTPTITAGQLYGGDTLTGLAQAFDSKNVLGTNGSTLTVTPGYTLTDAGNYAVTVKTAPGTITPLAIVATGTRVYDGDPDAPGSILTITDLVPGDSVGLTGTGTLGSKHVGTQTVTDPGTLALTGPDAGNYTVTGGTETVKVTPFAVVLYGTRVYDGETDGDSGILAVTNAFAGDTVTVASGTSTIANRDVGNEGITNFGTLTLGGASSGDYTLVGATGIVKVTPEMLTVTAVPGTKTYDGTTTSDGTPIVTTGTVFGPDTGNFIQTYGTQHAGTGITLTPTGSVNDGNGGKNYIVTYVPISTGIIDPLAVILSGSRVVDNQTDANSGILTITNLIPGDVATVTGNGVLKSPDVGPEQIVDFTGLTLQGPSSGDYTLVGATGIVQVTPIDTVPPVNIPNTQTASGPDNVAYDAGIIQLAPRQNGIVTGTIATIDGTDYQPDSQLGCTLGDTGCIQNGVAPTTTSATSK